MMKNPRNDKHSSRRNFLRMAGLGALLPALPSLAYSATGKDTADVSMHRVLCCNIRVPLEEDEAKGMGWKDRRELCMGVIKSHKPDIVCFQEVLKVQADDLRAYFRGYHLFGFEGPEMDPHPSGYFGIAKNPILFNTKKYELVTGGTYWLSETPLAAGSKSWDTARARHANWVRLKDKRSGIEFRVVNFHLDHISPQARIQQAKMVADDSAQYQPDFPQLWTGDFNARWPSPVFDSVRAGGWKDSYAVVHGDKDPGFTVHEFEGENYTKGKEKGKIDFIFYKGPVTATAAAIIKDNANGKYPSDHYFISADLRIG